MELPLILVMLKGYLEGGRGTLIEVHSNDLRVTITGRYRTTTWHCRLCELQPPRYVLGGIHLQPFIGWRGFRLRYATAAELKHVWLILRKAHETARTLTPSPDLSADNEATPTNERSVPK